MEPISLDVHAHLAPRDWQAFEGSDGVHWDAAGEALHIDGHAIGIKALFRPQELVAWMTANAVARAWVSIPPPLYRQDLRAAEARRWVDFVNTALAAIAAAHAPLDALPHLPLEHPAVAAEVATAWIDKGCTKFSAPAGGHAGVLSEAAYDPLWQSLNAAGAFLFLHPGECADSRLDAFYLGNLLGNPHETAVALAHLLFGGVIDRYPAITFCLAHGGGTAPMVAPRFQRGFDTKRSGLDLALQNPKRALRHVCVDCIVHDPAALNLSCEMVGEERVLFGSDWPFPMGLPKPHDQMRDVADARRRKIFSENARALFSLPDS